MSECDMTWWTLGNVVDWVRGIDPTATIGQIRVVLEKLCGSDRVHTRGHRRVYGYDRPVPIDHRDPTFVQFADEYGEPRSSFDEISATEWKDLTFFARATHVTNEPYHVALISALDRLTSPVELRSPSKRRLAWKDVEFWRDDVIEVWPEVSDAAEPNEANCEPQAGDVGEATRGRQLLIGRPAPLSDRDLRRWYKRYVAALADCGESSSGEDDWKAAKQEFGGRVTRARVRKLREQYAPTSWKKQGRRPHQIPK